jgi:hypothetical protein
VSKPAIEVTPDFFAPFSRKPPVPSTCEAYREPIEKGLACGRNGKAIWQDLVSQHGFTGSYQAVKRFVHKLRGHVRVERTLHVHSISIHTILFGAMVAFSAVAKVRRDPKVVHVIQEVVGVPLEYFPLLSACEFGGALGFALGIWFPWAGLAAGVGLVIYSASAVVSPLRVGDIKGIGPAVFMLIVAAGTLAQRLLTHTLGMSR